MRRYAVVVRSGSVLLVRRPGAAEWTFPSAEAAPGESLEASALRALKDAVGVEGKPGPALSEDALLLTGFSGALAPAGVETSWCEARRLLERPLSPEARPAAEKVAAHRRRDRYDGTHPKEFGQKYKELSGDREAMAKAAARGSTPAGAHLSIMVPEILEALSPLAGARVLDCTLGWGGHAEALARAGARVTGLDRDGEELSRTAARLKAAGVAVATLKTDYADAPSKGLPPFDGLLADLGVSSMQLDRPDRGMSFKADGPLDMRMDRSTGKTAAQAIVDLSEAALADALARLGDEPDAAAVAKELKRRAPKTTFQLSDAVAAAKGLPEGRFRKTDASTKHPAVRVFQALRLLVNDERRSLERLLAGLPSLVAGGGRVALLTFHSGEERLVEAALGSPAWTAVSAPRKASPEEVRLNPRARSARLWTARRA